jgi:hypothetical protein
MAPRIRYVGTVGLDHIYYGGASRYPDGDIVTFRPAEGDQRWITLKTEWRTNDHTPYRCGQLGPNVWIYKRKAYDVDNAAGYSPEELATHVKYAVLKREKEYDRIKATVAAGGLNPSSVRREAIPGSVRMFVWQRDKGQCTRCGSSERLEFDHIIPLAEGGSSTERNIQLLCETCNRSKGKRIG